MKINVYSGAEPDSMNQTFFPCVSCYHESGGMSMRQLWKDVLAAFVMGMVIPAILLHGAVSYSANEVEETVPEETKEVISVPLPMKFRESDGTVQIMDMDAYLTGVVLAEMPAEFEPEALKAQSVAARTYTRKAYETGGKHEDSSVCGDPSCCQAYISEEEYLQQGGTLENLEKVSSVVAQTSGQVLTYDGELIEATYFSCSGGTTEDAAVVWGADYPYLKSVESPGEENAQYHRDTVTFTPEAFAQALGRELEGSAEDWFTLAAYTAGGSVSVITICGEQYTGTQLRSLLGLRSAAFTVEASDSGIEITTKGYGHRVGMSQYGADAMAVSGSSYEEILTHYYPGTTLVRLRIDKNGDPEYPN